MNCLSGLETEGGFPLLNQDDDKWALQWWCKKQAKHDSLYKYLVDLYSPNEHIPFYVKGDTVILKKNHSERMSSWWVASLLFTKDSSCKSMLFSQARSLLKITVCSEKRKIARADCKTRRRGKHYELGVIASPLWWLCPCLWEVIPQTFFCWWVRVPSLGLWSSLLRNFLSVDGSTLGSERKCIKRRDGRVRELNHSAKVSFNCELWHQH